MTRIHARRGWRLTGALLIAGLAAAALSSPLGAQGPGELATVTVYPGGVDFRPNVSYSRAILTVSGNDRVFQRVLEAGEDLSIGFFDPEGQPLPEGVYVWQLELVADAETARELRIAATLNGGTAPEPWSALSGTFAILGGSVVPPDLSEPKPVRMTFSSGLPESSANLRFAASSTQVRLPGEDNDAAVGSRKDVEGKARAALGRQASTAFVTSLASPGPSVHPRSDATALSLGRSPEHPVSVGIQQPARTQSAPASRRTKSADGADGRPREDN